MKTDPKYYHLSLALYCLLIVILSSIPGDNFPSVEFEFSDKIVHFIEYAVLFSLFFYSLKNQSKYVRLQKFSLEYSFLFTALFGITDEIHQFFVTNRSCEFYDWVADVSGALIMYLIFKYIQRRKIISIVVLVLAVAVAYAGLDHPEPYTPKPKIWMESTESWLNLMPVIDEDKRNVFCFNIRLKFTGNSLDTNYEIRDFDIYMNNDEMKNKNFEKQYSEISDSSFILNIYQSPEEIYLDKNKEYPEEVSFTFNIMRKSRLIRNVKTYSTSILKTY